MNIASRSRDRQHLRPAIAICKRKASADHPEASSSTTARQQTFNDGGEKLAHLGTHIERAAGMAVAKSSQESVLAEGSLVHDDQPMWKNGGSTMEVPIVIDDDDANGLSCPEPEPASPWCGDNTVVSPFGYTTWDPTDGGRYELLSTYMPPPSLDADEEDALWWLAAVYTSPDLYTSPADVFWGTPDGVWTSY
jgi:hypothetical protein